MIQQTINIAGIMEDSIVDGPGLRTAIFAQGCPRRCEGCHNPESWAFGTGTDMTVQDLFWRVKKNPLVRGVTFSGGEPFSQAEPFTELAKLLKANGYEVASYTGYTFEELLENGTPAQKQLLAALDILVDGEFVLAQRNLDLRFRGSENQRILDVPQSLAQGRAVWCTAARWVGERQALVPGGVVHVKRAGRKLRPGIGFETHAHEWSSFLYWSCDERTYYSKKYLYAQCG